MRNIDYSKIFPLKDYYAKVVVPLDSKFSVIKADKYICCLHEDKDPSLGILHSKSSGEVFHCFGCNAWGNVIDLHKKVSYKYFGKNLDEEQAKRELCKIFGIDYNSLPKEENLGGNNRDREVKKILAFNESLNKFNFSDYKYNFIEGKLAGKGVQYFNNLMVAMIVSEKEKEV